MWQSHTSLGEAVIIGEANIIQKSAPLSIDKGAFFYYNSVQLGVISVSKIKLREIPYIRRPSEISG